MNELSDDTHPRDVPTDLTSNAGGGGGLGGGGGGGRGLGGAGEAAFSSGFSAGFDRGDPLPLQLAPTIDWAVGVVGADLPLETWKKILVRALRAANAIEEAPDHSEQLHAAARAASGSLELLITAIGGETSHDVADSCLRSLWDLTWTIAADPRFKLLSEVLRTALSLHASGAG